MYDLPNRFLVANPIDRYSIGSRSPQLKKAGDGSITLYVQKESPGKENESNWLPGPNGPLFMVMRMYGPTAAVRNGEWTIPPLQRVK
jgi:hypothetical protein